MTNTKIHPYITTPTFFICLSLVPIFQFVKCKNTYFRTNQSDGKLLQIIFWAHTPFKLRSYQTLRTKKVSQHHQCMNTNSSKYKNTFLGRTLQIQRRVLIASFDVLVGVIVVGSSCGSVHCSSNCHSLTRFCVWFESHTNGRMLISFGGNFWSLCLDFTAAVQSRELRPAAVARSAANTVPTPFAVKPRGPEFISFSPVN